MEKRFIITVDTEPDGQWDLNAPPTTKNVQFIPRFQELCWSYGFKPVYLTDYVMMNDPAFVDYNQLREMVHSVSSDKAGQPI